MRVSLSVKELRINESFPKPAVASIMLFFLVKPFMVFNRSALASCLDHFKKSQKILPDLLSVPFFKYIPSSEKIKMYLSFKERD
ncbi:uncharacterized protein METZ01_LOCUS111996 [marine metagenome]|uniref:Uncharacterized protein n=1 Tax=marine metagenome TaxID=408172 RepID=A0A381X3G4_9ZZZZ